MVTLSNAGLLEDLPAVIKGAASALCASADFVIEAMDAWIVALCQAGSADFFIKMPASKKANFSNQANAYVRCIEVHSEAVSNGSETKWDQRQLGDAFSLYASAGTLDHELVDKLRLTPPVAEVLSGFEKKALTALDGLHESVQHAKSDIKALYSKYTPFVPCLVTWSFDSVEWIFEGTPAVESDVEALQKG